MGVKRKTTFKNVRISDTALTVSQVVGLNANGQLQTATAMDDVIIGATTPAAGTFTTLTADTLLFGTRSSATHNYGSAHVTWVLTAAESKCLILKCTGTANDACEADLPAATVGLYVLNNACGQNVSLVVAGGTGVTVANGKYALLLADGTNVVRVTADT